MSKTLLWIIVAIVVIVAIGVIGYMVVKSAEQKTISSSSQTTETIGGGVVQGILQLFGGGKK